MLSFDTLREVLASIGKNKMRTFLTGLAVAWGIFMLVILLAAGNGFENGIKSNFQKRAVNSVSIWPGSTSMPYKGMALDRTIKFDVNDYLLLKEQIPEIEFISPTIFKQASISYGQEYGSWTLAGVSDEVLHIYSISIPSGSGRFINPIDIRDRKKVIVINSDMKKVLFKDEDPIGKLVMANNLIYKVIGIYDDDDARQSPPAYIPFTTAQLLYNEGYGFGRIDFTVNGLKTEKANTDFNDRLRDKIGRLHNFDPKDKSALYIRNTAERAMESEKIFNTIGIVIWFIGIVSLIGGIVGVGNIMLVTVKERTKEIGIRKAIGATPRSILKLIIIEAILITTVSGYFGLTFGVFIVELINLAMSGMPSDGPSIFKDPQVDFGVVINATIFLITAGVAAGLMPAIRATKVSPIEAMRAD